jgi:hypothetical protein
MIMSLDMTDTNMLMCKIVMTTDRQAALKMFIGILSRKFESWESKFDRGYGTAITMIPATLVLMVAVNFLLVEPMQTATVLTAAVASALTVILMRSWKLRKILLLGIDILGAYKHVLENTHPEELSEAFLDIEVLLEDLRDFDGPEFISINSICLEFNAMLADSLNGGGGGTAGNLENV